MCNALIVRVLPFVLAFVLPLLLTLLLTPIVREVHRKWGLVDKPDPRRINKVPIPRGGGMAIVVGVTLGYALFAFLGDHFMAQASLIKYWKVVLLSIGIALLGLADDRYSLPPRIKLLGQVVVAFLAWAWADVGFSILWAQIPWWLDSMLTVFWITGAVNAFNLIDGLDGLASGIALIATLGMTASCFLLGSPQSALIGLVIAGALLGFLRYNYHPASVFLGDSGSMYIGFVLSTLSLLSRGHDSFLVLVGVPVLAMGVPIFDTSLAIVRRSLRRLISRGEAASGQVMTADTDHLHHRLLRATGLNQRKTAWILYATTVLLVTIGLVALHLKSRAVGFWMASFALVSVVLFKDATIEIFDAGRYLNSMARNTKTSAQKLAAFLSVPFYVVFDLLALIGVYFLCLLALGLPITEQSLRICLPVRVVSTFLFLTVFRAYHTVWARAMISNYARLAIACAFGAVLGSAIFYYCPFVKTPSIFAMTILHATVSFAILLCLRVIRMLVRDLFYALDCRRLKEHKNVSRVLVYGAGLRYRAFRRELVRTTSANDRIIIGLLDDDVYLKGRYIGGIQILGTINDAPEIINAHNVDAVVIACEISEEKMKSVKDILSPTGVKISLFSLSEQPV